jgi:hypothetical protein
MTVVGGMELGRELAQLVAQINKLIASEVAMAESIGVDVFKLRDSSNDLVLVPLLAAKAQALHSLVLINQRG